MMLNKEKSAIMFITSKNDTLTNWEKKNKHILNIPIVTNYKYLGIILNKKMEPTKHIEKLNTKM